MAGIHISELEEKSVKRIESDGAVISLLARTEILSNEYSGSVKQLTALFNGFQQRTSDDETFQIEIKDCLYEVSTFYVVAMFDYKVKFRYPIPALLLCTVCLYTTCSSVGIYPMN